MVQQAIAMIVFHLIASATRLLLQEEAVIPVELKYTLLAKNWVIKALKRGNRLMLISDRIIKK